MPIVPFGMARSAMKPDRMLFAWLWPGGGYFAERRYARGVRAMGGVLFLYLSGLLIGGLDAVDRKHDGIWFYAQAFNGPIAFATDFARSRLSSINGREIQDISWERTPSLGERWLAEDQEVMDAIRRQGLSHVNEVGTLFIALGGLMNLVLILEAGFAAPKGEV